MTSALNPSEGTEKLAALLNKIPVGITLIDLVDRIRYSNDDSARIVDRRPEYIGRGIRSCHQKAESIARSDRMREDIRSGRREEVD
ncbi:MAG: PAS domain-containing protein [Desulfobacterales bacterium]